jgi:hypothetical protein
MVKRINCPNGTRALNSRTGTWVSTRYWHVSVFAYSTGTRIIKVGSNPMPCRVCHTCEKATNDQHMLPRRKATCKCHLSLFLARRPFIAQLFPSLTTQRRSRRVGLACINSDGRFVMLAQCKVAAPKGPMELIRQLACIRREKETEVCLGFVGK